jgi:hypothetical protein
MGGVKMTLATRRAPRRPLRQAILLLVCALALGAALGSLGTATARANSPVLTLIPDLLGGMAAAPPARAAALADPALALTPNQAPCGTPVAARGAGFPPGRAVEIVVSGGQTKPTGGAPTRAVVAADGTFALDLLPCASPDAAPDGTQYAVAASAPNADPFAPPDAFARAIFTVGPIAQRPPPTLTLAPESGACNGPAVVSGTNWSPGDTLALSAFPLGGHQGVEFASVMVGADGTFALPFELHRATLCSAGYAPPLGARYRIGAGPDLKQGSRSFDFASMTYTIARERLTERCFAATGRCVRGAFHDRWERHGLAGNGYPLTDEFEQPLEDGKTYTVQYFERVRLEYHPENPAPHDILLGQFGRRIVAAVPDAPLAPAAPQAGGDYFAETGHNVDARFFAYWLHNGGLEQFGFPLTELFEQRLEDGEVYQVQYFERARFEHHLEHAGTPYAVLLGQFGRRILSESTPRTLALDPVSGPCPGARTVVVARGGGFTPGVVTRFVVRRDRDGEITGGNSLAGGKPANADGTYESTLPLSECGPDEPIGSTFTITVAEYYSDRTPTRGPSASATFTVTASATGVAPGTPPALAR